MNEEWKDIIGYRGFYQISNYGRVKSFKNNTEKIIKNINGNYLTVKLHDWNKHVNIFLIHHLVWDHFGDKIRPLPHKKINGNCYVIDHINENKLDNRISNLQLVTNSYNINKSIKFKNDK